MWRKGILYPKFQAKIHVFFLFLWKKPFLLSLLRIEYFVLFDGIIVFIRHRHPNVESSLPIPALLPHYVMPCSWSPSVPGSNLTRSDGHKRTYYKRESALACLTCPYNIHTTYIRIQICLTAAVSTKTLTQGTTRMPHLHCPSKAHLRILLRV